MAARGSALGRAVRFFKESPIEEAEAAFILVERAMAARKKIPYPTVTAPMKKRRARKTATPPPAETRVLATEDQAKATLY